MQGTHHIVCLI